jgi:hypothetical protein
MISRKPGIGDSPGYAGSEWLTLSDSFGLKSSSKWGIFPADAGRDPLKLMMGREPVKTMSGTLTN